MAKRLFPIFFALCLAIGANAQIVADDDNAFVADSLLRACDNMPYFTLYKDNYFTVGTNLGGPITSKNSDVKFQLSIAQRLTKSTLPFNTYLFLMYSQKCFWNVFEESLPMRDLNFNPGIGLAKWLIVKNRVIGKATMLIEHESNGRDGDDSRSWNRITFGASIYIDPNVMIFGKVWIPIIDGENNKDILDYCGIYSSGLSVTSPNKRFGFTVITTKRKGWRLSYNTTVELNYRIFRGENQYFFAQYYNGYGEGLLDYNQYHSRFRVGLVIKPQFFSDF